MKARRTVSAFDIGALVANVKSRCDELGMSFSTAASQIGISPSTLKGMSNRSAVEADGVLQVMRWLGVEPEELYSNTVRAPLPAVPSPATLRIDAQRLYASLDVRRRDRDTTWTSIARDLRENSATVTRLAQGGRVSIQLVARIAAYLQKPMAEFVAARRS